MRRWIAVLALVAAAILAASVVTPAKAAETTSVRPGGLYTINVSVTKPTGSSFSTDWEIRAYFYSSTNCFNAGEWWQPSGSSDWIYSGWYQHRVRNQSWTTPDTKSFSITAQLVNYPRGAEGPAYPSAVGPTYSSAMTEMPTSGVIRLRTRMLIRNLSAPSFSGDSVTFKVGSTTYTYKFDQLGDDYQLKTPSGGSVGSGATLTQSSSGEWELKWDSTQDVLVDNNAPSTGTITMTSPIELGLAASAMDVTIFLGVGLVVVGVAAVFLFMKMRKRGGDVTGPEFAPPAPTGPPAPPPSSPPPPQPASEPAPPGFIFRP
ncbi:MAG: hypothetical protein AB1305_01790 [Candidatus Hadarchaeota archaeon]